MAHKGEKMGLKDCNFKPDYNKSDDDIAKDFYIPSMINSCQYNRISGYFGSTIYIIAWSALQRFVENGGHMRIICSPCVSENDKVALQEGYNAQNDQILRESLDKELNKLFTSSELEKPARVLACLISKDILEVKIAVPMTDAEPDLQRLFHDKVGIFTDENGDSVGFRGSMNETFQGLSEDGNAESIDVFPSWADSRDSSRLKRATEYFDKLWNNQEIGTKVFEFPEAVKKNLIDKSNGYDWTQLSKEISTRISKAKKWKPDKKHSVKSPREHQLIALENWVKNYYRGILEHATGSGKTFTAICAIRNALDRGKTVLVLVPSKELLNQWNKEICANITDIKLNILLCGDGNNSWKSDNTLALWTRPTAGANKITIAIMDTACGSQFINNMSSGENLLMVADEVHRIGSSKRRNILKIDAEERLGLSATPIRYGDPIGTKAIFDFFGGIIQPVFSLEDAINSNVLTKYYYYPITLMLNSDEQEKWNTLTDQINKMLAINGGDKPIGDLIDTNPRLKMKIIERSRIIKQASGKIRLALDVVKKYYKKGQRWIIYCDNSQQLHQVLTLLLNNGYDAYEYYSEMNGDREQTLKYFSLTGGLLVSIRCLDEGVDIPATTHALILASSKNPREFIQRRGRILRRYKGKYYAQLYDAIVMPERFYNGDEDKSISIIESELSRAIQFGEWAENPSCVSDLKIIAQQYGIKYDELVDGGYEDDGEYDDK